MECEEKFICRKTAKKIQGRGSFVAGDLSKKIAQFFPLQTRNPRGICAFFEMMRTGKISEKTGKMHKIRSHQK